MIEDGPTPCTQGVVPWRIVDLCQRVFDEFRITHHVHILEMNGESYRLRQSKARQRRKPQPSEPAPVVEPNENNGV